MVCRRALGFSRRGSLPVSRGTRGRGQRLRHLPVSSPVTRCPASGVHDLEVGAVLTQESDDLQLILEAAGCTTRAGPRRGQVQRRGASLAQPTVGVRAERQQRPHRRRASRTHRPMQRRRAALIGPIQLGSVLDQQFDHGGLLRRRSASARIRPRVTRVMKGRCPATVLRVRIGTRSEQNLDGRRAEEPPRRDAAAYRRHRASAEWNRRGRRAWPS